MFWPNPISQFFLYLFPSTPQVFTPGTESRGLVVETTTAKWGTPSGTRYVISHLYFSLVYFSRVCTGDSACRSRLLLCSRVWATGILLSYAKICVGKQH